jgi:hypothetical protein
MESVTQVNRTETDEPRLRSFTVDDPRLWDDRPRLSFAELTIEGVTDEEWDAFYAALAEE